MQPICKVAFAHQYNTELMLYYSCCNFEMQVLICDLMLFPLLSGNQKPKLKNNTTIVDVLVSNPITSSCCVSGCMLLFVFIVILLLLLTYCCYADKYLHCIVILMLLTSSTLFAEKHLMSIVFSLIHRWIHEFLLIVKLYKSMLKTVSSSWIPSSLCILL